MAYTATHDFRNLNGYSILVVGDCSTISYGIVAALKARGFDAACCECFTAADVQLMANPDTIVLADINACPAALEISREFISRHPRVVIVALISRTDNLILAEEYLSVGFTDVFYQGDDLSLLLKRLEMSVAVQELREEGALTLERCKNAERELEEYVYVVSHDLKAPLRGIASLTDFIREELGECLKPEIDKLFRMMQSRTDRLQQMIEGILHYSRTAGRDHPSEQTDVKALISNEIEENFSTFAINIQIPDALPVLVTDSIKLKEVFHNILINGIQHNDKEDKSLHIACRDMGDSFEFSVTDNGKGIRPEHCEKIFGLFQTLQPKDESQGLGLGLSIVKRIVEQQRGCIRVESTPGAGSTFSFTWRKQGHRACLNT
jgi:signal transduction histidine kinase